MGPENHFLESLSPPDREVLTPSLKRIDLQRDQQLAEAGRPVTHAYLPVGAIISVLATMRDGRSVESRTVGREGGFGLLHAIGSRYSFESVIVQVGGPCYRLPLDALSEAAAKSPSLVKSIATHAQGTIVQSAQSTACNALHGVHSRLCRWLLLTQDRLMKDVLPLTQEHLSIMLGVQRTTVTAAASDLQARGWIVYSRGKITVKNREALLGASCECYEAIETASAQLLSDPTADHAHG